MSISLKKEASRPGFTGVADALRAEILRGALPPGRRLPAISDLAGTHRTTPITVRRALRELEDEGLVSVEHGVGTFVADWGRHHDLQVSAAQLPGFPNAVPHGELETRLVAVKSGIQAPEAARALRIPCEAPVWALVRVRLVAGTPVVYQTSYVGEELRTVVEEYSPEQSLYELLGRQVGRPPQAAEETLDMAPLPQAAAMSLDLPPGTPGWRSVRTTLGHGGEPLVYDDAYLPASRVRLRIRRRGGQALMSFELHDLTIPEEDQE